MAKAWRFHAVEAAVNQANEIYAARNRTRIPHKVYLYEAVKNILDGFAGGTVSDNVNAIVIAFLLRTGRTFDFLKERDRLRIREIRRVLTSCG
jgi:hypothetical protein